MSAVKKCIKTMLATMHLFAVFFNIIINTSITLFVSQCLLTVAYFYFLQSHELYFFLHIVIFFNHKSLLFVLVSIVGFSFLVSTLYYFLRKLI